MGLAALIAFVTGSEETPFHAGSNAVVRGVPSVTLPVPACCCCPQVTALELVRCWQ